MASCLHPVVPRYPMQEKKYEEVCQEEAHYCYDSVRNECSSFFKPQQCPRAALSYTICSVHKLLGRKGYECCNPMAEGQKGRIILYKMQRLKAADQTVRCTVSR
eukprot:4684902-Amphidinium_carterae.1